MSPLFSFLCAVIILVITHFQNLVVTAGIVLENAEICHQDSGGIKYLKYEKINRTTKGLSMNITLTSPIDSNVGLKVDAEKWTSSGWIKMPYLPVIPDACNMMKRFYSQYTTEFWKKGGVKNPENCPIPAGDYSITNYVFAYNDNGVRVQLPVKGRVRLTTSLVDMTTKKVLVCATLHIQML